MDGSATHRNFGCETGFAAIFPADPPKVAKGDLSKLKEEAPPPVPVAPSG